MAFGRWHAYLIRLMDLTSLTLFLSLAMGHFGYWLYECAYWRGLNYVAGDIDVDGYRSASRAFDAALSRANDW